MRLLAVSCLALLVAVRAQAGSIVQLGCPDLNCATTPAPNSGFLGVATGNYHTMGLRADGKRGSLLGFPVGSGADEACLASGTGTAFIDEGSVPASGAGAYFLVRAANVCGRGTYGVRSSGVERTSAACP